MKERVIYLKDLFYYVCRKWRVALVMMLLFAVAFNFYGWYRAKAAAESIDVSAEDTLNALKEGLTERQIMDAEDRARNYCSYYRQYMDLGDYMDHSVYFKLNPSAVPTYEAVYYVEETAKPQAALSDNSSGETSDVLYAFASYVGSDEVRDRIGAAMEMQDRIQYISELYLAEVSGNTLKLTVFAEDEAKAKNAGEALKTAIEEKQDSFRDIYGEYTLFLVSEHSCTAADPRIIEGHSKVTSRNVELESIMQSTGNNLPSAAKKYYEALLDRDSSEIIDDTSKKSTPRISLLRPKWILIGLVLGGVLFVLFYAFRYVFSNRIQTAEELEDYYGIPVLSRVRSGKTGTCIDKAVRRLFTRHEVLFDPETGVKTAAEEMLFFSSKERPSLIICSDGARPEEIEFVEALAKALKENGAAVSTFQNIYRSVASVKTLSEADGIVYIRSLRRSMRSALEAELKEAGKVGTKVIGAVALSD